jgi:hypothetical protein
MKIIFEKKENQEKQLTIADVEENQFFVCSDGYLCQKLGSYGYTTIANSNGQLYSGYFSCDAHDRIKRILPKITKIEF